MKAAVYEGIRKIRVKEFPAPVCQDNNIVIKVHSCAICGTDIRTYNHGKSNVVPPQVIGHEVAGEVFETGRNIREFKKGDKVAVAAIISCGKCDFCEKGMMNLCRNVSALGYEYAGGFAEYMLVPGNMLKDGSVNIIPENLSYDEACIAEPFACVINGQELVDLKKNDIVGIIGAGPIGCMHVALAKSKMAKKIIHIDISNERLKLAEKYGADLYLNPKINNLENEIDKITKGKGLDVVIIAASSLDAATDAVEIAGFRTRINFFAGFPKDNPIVHIDGNLIHYKEISIVGSSGSLPRQNQEAIKLFSSGLIKAEEFITHSFKLEDILEGIKTVEAGVSLKVVINP